MHIVYKLHQATVATATGNGQSISLLMQLMESFYDMRKSRDNVKGIVFIEQTTIGFYTSVAHFVCHGKQIGKSLLQR